MIRPDANHKPIFPAHIPPFDEKLNMTRAYPAPDSYQCKRSIVLGGVNSAGAELTCRTRIGGHV